MDTSQYQFRVEPGADKDWIVMLWRGDSRYEQVATCDSMGWAMVIAGLGNTMFSTAGGTNIDKIGKVDGTQT